MSRLSFSVMRSGILLALIAVAGVALLSGVHLLTRERIAEQEVRVFKQRLGQVLAQDAYDNDLRQDMISVRDPIAFSHPGPVRIFRARKAGQPAAVIIEITAPDGYHGDIRMLVGILYDGTISGVRVTAHKETPGLGDDIDSRRSDWAESFRGRTLNDPDLQGWAVRKDGGEFDQFTGATISPRAVVEAVQRALEYHDQHRAELYRQTAQEDSG